MAQAQIAFDDSVAAVPAVFYPSPIKDVITFECFHTMQEPFDFYVYDMQGRCAITKHVEFSGSYQSVTIDARDLQSGSYVVKYFMNRRQYIFQVSKL